MKKGFCMEKGYMCLYLYPFGIEILIEEGFQIAFIIAKLEFNISIHRNYTIFGDIEERALRVENKIKKDLTN